MLKVQNPGFYTSIQDLGRFGFRHLGVPVSGVADQGAAMRSNALLENDPNDAVLEITMNGPVLEFTEPTQIVLCGAPLEAFLDGIPLEMNQIYKVSAGAMFTSGHVREGLRAYLSVKGGFQSEPKLGSRSQFFPITPGNTVRKGALIPYRPNTDFTPKLLKIKPTKVRKYKFLSVSPGPEYELFDKDYINNIFNIKFQISKNHNRMACQLEPSLPGHDIRIITSATLPGTVQITPSGRLIVLMRDGQTTGGYPRILQLDADSQDRLGQKQFGDVIRFEKSENGQI
ncbi:MAG: biotin-dependent carboxyltransferase family protein [Robiginitalea sp.]|uniref:5-oxoprolinase subunit C family protein n=1 Tax=Robiginitalea sp. TaxID=1902411 RepID=UPI003C74B4D5